MDSKFPMRINKYLAEIGAATRRGADVLIEKGKVFVNGQRAVVGQKIGADDVVEVRDNKKQYRYVLYYKPRGVITHSPLPNETDIETQIKRDHGITGLSPIGRLDKDSEGLILLTDDGRVTDRILNPKHAHIREYEVTVDKPVTEGFLMKMKEGVVIEGYVTKRAFAEKVSKYTFRLKLTEGKKHQVRRMCAALGYQVQRLVRISLLTLEQSGLTSGQYRNIAGAELDEFLEKIRL